MSETHLANEPEARTASGEIKNLATTTETKTPEQLAAEAKTAPALTEPAKTPEQLAADAAAAAKAEGDKTLLNKKDEAKPAGAPEKYEAFKVPEGFVLDEAVAKEAGDIFKNLGLDQAQGQSLVDFYAAKTKEAAEQPYNEYLKMREGWQNDVKADPEIGSRLPQVKETVSRALDSLGDPKLAADFRAAMDLTGAGDHPAFIKAFYKLAQQVTEGKAVKGMGPSTAGQQEPGKAPPSAAHALYPNLP